MRRVTPKSEGLYRRLAEKYLEGEARRCEHLPRCAPGTPLADCPRPSSLARGLAAGEPVELSVWQLPARPGDYGLDPYERVRVSPDGRIGPASPVTHGPRPAWRPRR